MGRGSLRAGLAGACLALGYAGPAPAATTYTVSGPNPAAIQGTVDVFRAALGTNNGNGGSFSGGRREVSWDDAPDDVADPNRLPSDYYNSAIPRGIAYVDPGFRAFRVSADASNPTGTAPL